MAWDTAGTKRKILEAATREFALLGPAGTTVEQIAKAAGVNKERIYAYYGGKPQLFAHVLREQLATAAQDVPADMTSSDGIAEYAGRLFDFALGHPALARLLKWEALAFESEVPEEHARRDYYAVRTAEFAQAQAAGVVVDTIDPDLLYFMLLSLAAYWAAMPQVARMITAHHAGRDEKARRRAAVVDAARRLVSPAPRARKRS